jgi:DNA primase small subunit
LQVEDYIRKKFAEYYMRNSYRIKPPPQMEKREYGFILFKEKMMIRHKSFGNVEELKSFIENVAPSDAYHSAAYYLKPEEDMEKKGWLGADLIFDLDADHIETPCKKQHDKWVCENCGTSGKGQAPENCPACQQMKIKEEAWLCEQCLEKAKDETIKLIDMLISDFGLAQNQMSIHFSGHRGYHLHVRSEEVIGLSESERREIVDYILGTGLDPVFHGLLVKKGKTESLTGPELTDPGWRGRLARGVYEILTKAEEIELMKFGLTKSAARKIVEKRDELTVNWLKKIEWGSLSGVGFKAWRKIAEKAVTNKSARIDTVVTTDIHRLIRLTETLNGKTGLRVLEVKDKNLEAFDPFKEALAFEGEETIYIKEAPQFRLGEETYGPYQKQKKELPAAAALLLICKGKAVPVNE